MLGEDYDGQMRMVVPEKSALEAQITGQMSIQDILEEWEKTKRAAEKALQEAEQQKLESAKAKALAEAGDIMERLADVIPQLDAGLTSKELLEKEYLGKLPEEEAGQLVANMNDILQQQIDSISQANAKIDEFLAAGVPGQSGEAAAGAADAMEIPEGEGIAVADEEEPAGTEEMTELSPEEELPEIALPDDIAEEVAATEAEEVSDAAEEVLPKIQLEPEAETEDAKPEEKLPEIAEPDSDEDNIGERNRLPIFPRSRKLSLLILFRYPEWSRRFVRQWKDPLNI